MLVYYGVQCMLWDTLDTCCKILATTCTYHRQLGSRISELYFISMYR